MHYYQDTSHFRAPYKNIAVQGIGAETGSPATTPPIPEPAAGTITAAHIDAVSFVGPDGVRRYKPEAKAAIMAILEQYRYVFLTNTNVKVVPISPQEQAAMLTDPAVKAQVESMRATKWIADKVKEGYAVMVPFTIMWGTAQALATQAGIQIGGTKAADKEAMKAASSWPTPEAPIGAYIAEPGEAQAVVPGKPATAGITPALWALGIVAVIGGAAYAMTRTTRPRVGRSTMPSRL